MPYTDFQALLDPQAPPGWRWYNTGEHLSGLTDEAIDTLIAHAPRGLAPLTQIIVFRHGGAVSRSMMPRLRSATGKRRTSPELHARRRRAGARRLRSWQACPTGRAQGQVRPRQPLPLQPQHPAQRRLKQTAAPTGSRDCWQARLSLRSGQGEPRRANGSLRAGVAIPHSFGPTLRPARAAWRRATPDSAWKQRFRRMRWRGRDSNPRWTVRPATVFETGQKRPQSPIAVRACGRGECEGE
jgi:hypothetical protein